MSSDDLSEQLRWRVAEVELGTPVERARNATRFLAEEAPERSAELARFRREAVEEMLAEGYSKTEIARLVDLHPSRITRVLNGNDTGRQAT